MTENGSRSQKTSSAGMAQPAASLLGVPVFKQSAERGRTIPQSSAASSSSPPPSVAEADAPGEANLGEGLVDAGALAGAAMPPVVEQPQRTDSAVERAAEPKAAPAGEGQAVAGSDTPPQMKDMRRYWRRLGHGRYPDIEDLDAGTIASNWPNTLLIRVDRDGLVDIVRVYATEAGGADTNGADGGPAPAHPFAGDHYAQLSSWVLELARQAAREAMPLQRTEDFSLGTGRRALTARVLPCGSRTDPADYVLLNISEDGG
jgi:hypothetical protein